MAKKKRFKDSSFAFWLIINIALFVVVFLSTISLIVSAIAVILLNIIWLIRKLFVMFGKGNSFDDVVLNIINTFGNFKKSINKFLRYNPLTEATFHFFSKLNSLLMKMSITKRFFIVKVLQINLLIIEFYTQTLNIWEIICFILLLRFIKVVQRMDDNTNDSAIELIIWIMMDLIAIVQLLFYIR
ncbi:hypothetical protein MOO46_05240 [Apilactobacillus apisilvae]|uniref:Uncharacterized protein n=1 Tax=Apilactobacillus apisilvae TaxID=2923364 RepID=A0ABY4PG76_9LACO|nr:hypothetical protein [Apilactobacillus apisilvae]UQS84655.1 hypothetical protein MOO46_05240 [Apilactobacillus apisilvae]